MIRSLIVVALAGFCLTLGPNQTEAQTFSASRSLSPQGYSGGVMTPSAFTLPFGSVSATHDRQLPGAAYPHGYNYQLGFGLAPGFEFVGRLATQDLGCDLFRLVGCRVPSPIRDFSASMKFQLPVPWDKCAGQVWPLAIPMAAVQRPNFGLITRLQPNDGKTTNFHLVLHKQSQQQRRFMDLLRLFTMHPSSGYVLVRNKSAVIAG